MSLVFLTEIKNENNFFLNQALDLWMAGCMIFVFASLGEFIVVKVLDLRRIQLAETVANYQRHFTAVIYLLKI